MKTHINKHYSENNQNLLELMLASNNYASPYIKGNLARELAQIYHALSDTDLLSFSNPQHTVYINAHIALPISPLNNSKIKAKIKSLSNSTINSTFTFTPTPSLTPTPTPIPITSPLKSITSSMTSTFIRNYHTLLFPDSQPDHHIIQPHSSFSDASQNIQKLMLMTNPKNNITEIALAAAIPIHKAIQITTSLVQNNICIVSHVISRSSHFTCQDNAHQKIASVALQFAQKFGDLGAGNTLPPLFLVVNAFTSSPSLSLTLGQIIALVTSSQTSSFISSTNKSTLSNNHTSHADYDQINLHNNITDLPSAIKPLKQYVENISKKANHSSYQNYTNHNYHQPNIELCNTNHLPIPSNNIPTNHGQTTNNVDTSNTTPTMSSISPSSSLVNKKIENILFSMVVWLRAQNILIDIRDYLISRKSFNSIPIQESPFTGNDEKDNPINLHYDDDHDHDDSYNDHKTNEYFQNTATSDNDPKNNVPNDEEEKKMYHTLLEGKCLTGKVSTVAICWRYSWERTQLSRFIEWGSKTKRIDVIRRIPVEGDDWGAP